MRAADACTIVAIVVAGCGPGRPTTEVPAEGGRLAAPAPAAIDLGSAPEPVAGPATPTTAPVTADECGRLVDRLIAIGLAEQHARDPRAPQATAEQQAAIRAQLLTQALPGCATMPRASWDCAIAAGDRAAMMACESAAGDEP